LAPTQQHRSAGFLLKGLKEKLIKIGAKIVTHGRYVALQMAKAPSHRIYSRTTRTGETLGRCHEHNLARLLREAISSKLLMLQIGRRIILY
jgi:hypothetical protein